MTIFIHDDRSLKIDASNLGVHEKHLVEKLWSLSEKHGYDLDSASTGVFPCPDFGYFELAVRYWRASLCIYFAGFSKAFIEAGAGFLEPWLFNSRHAIELYTKGLLLYVAWYQELNEDSLKSGHKKQIEKIKTAHNPITIYEEYKDKLETVLSTWNSDEICEAPELDKLVLTERGKDILFEISEADPTSFRFRYPSLLHSRGENESFQRIQQMSWEWNEEKLFPVTGLPREAGVAFTHVKVINNMHDLFKELSDIGDYHGALYAHLEELQGFASEW
jgi:hypothetical protein